MAMDAFPSLRAPLLWLLLGMGCWAPAGLEAQEPQQPIPSSALYDVDLPMVFATGGLRGVNRTPGLIAPERGRQAVYLGEGADAGVAWIEGMEMGDGIIEVELRGRDRQGESFVGIVFHGADDATYEGVYLRPFNFRHPDSGARERAVQYISHPDHGWRELREESPGAFEAGIPHPPSGDDWVTLRLELRGTGLRVFVDGNLDPVLEVERLGPRRRGKLGLWVGNGSDGTFRALRISAAFRAEER